MFGWLKDRKIALLASEVRLIQKQIEGLEFDIDLLRRGMATQKAQVTRKARKKEEEDQELPDLSMQEREFLASLSPDDQKALSDRIKNSRDY